MPVDISSKNGLQVYRFPNLLPYPEIMHGVFTRVSGFSQEPFDGLNVSLNVGDHPDDIIRNRQAISSELGGNELVFIHQVHGATVLRLKNGEPIRPKPADIQTGDAVVTDIPGKMLVVQVADCQPILLFDPDKRVVAAVHSGWRGSVQNIIEKTIQAMVHHFQCSPQAILAGVGPSLGPCCAEFIHYKTELPESFRQYQVRENHFDFWAISRDQLRKTGVQEKNIHVSPFCTKCRTDLFYSYRSRKQTGRFAAAIGLSKKQQESL